MLQAELPTHIRTLKTSLFDDLGIHVSIKREDKNHALIQGNKFRKIVHNIAKAEADGMETLVTFGGAFSNHILATAAAGYEVGMKTVGMIRGERIEPLNPTLNEAEALGMTFEFVSRYWYRQKNFQQSTDWILNRYGQETTYILPEGGTNNLAIKGCAEIVTEVENQLDVLPNYWVLPVGTGGTMAGIVAGLSGRSSVLGISALKGSFLQKDVEKLLVDYNGKRYENWAIQGDYHFGGYAKHKPELIRFINQFKWDEGIQLEPIYTGKMMYAIYDLAKQGYFPKGSHILAIHTGGLQGIKGFNSRFGKLLK